MTPASRKKSSMARAWRRRLHASPVPRPALGRRLEQWSTRGGRICLVGPRRSGRTSLLSMVLRTLHQGRRPHLLFRAGSIAGLDVRATLQLLGEEPTVPRFPEVARRARHAAARILRGWRSRHGSQPLLVVVDDIHAVDLLTRSVLAALLREPRVQMLGAGDGAVDGLAPVEIPILSAEQVAELAPDAPGTLQAMHVGAALVHRAVGAGVLLEAEDWSSLQRLHGLSPDALRLLQLLATSFVPVPRAGAGRLLALEQAGLARACSELIHRGLLMGSGERLRLASPIDAVMLRRHLSVSSEVHRQAASLLDERHPGRVAHAAESPPGLPEDLEAAFDALMEWDPSSAARWRAAILARARPPGLVRRAAEAAMACRQRMLAVRIVQQAAQDCTDLYVKVSLLSLAGCFHLSAPPEPSAARAMLQAAQ